MRRHLRKAGSEQGGALVEFALSTLLLVPVAFYSMYIGEAYMASIKAQEAEIAGGWEMTAYRLHDYQSGNANSLYNSALTRTTTQVKEKMTDLNSFAGNGTGQRTAIADSKLTAFKCERRDGVRFGPTLGPVLGNKYLKAEGFVACKAEVEFKTRSMPTDPYRDIQHVGPKMLQASAKQLKFCGLGPGPTGCDGRLGGMVLLTNDYGLEASMPNQVGTKGNERYFNVGEAIYKDPAGVWLSGFTGVTAAMGEMLGLPDLGKTSTFKMGYLATVSEHRGNFSPHGGKRPSHLSPYHDVAQAEFAENTDASKLIHDQRSVNNYFGHTDPRFNSP